jgi:hypothetical protein
MDAPLYRCWTKATNREAGSPRRSWNWTVSRRAWFKVFQDRVECGDWEIPLDSTRRAVMFRGRSLFLPIRVLHLEMEDKTYQFGFNPWVRIESRLPFEVARQELRLGYSLFSVVLRIVVAAYIVYWLWQAVVR